ncbi:MAG TPA: malonyl-CoA decarboxylase, partial [Terriglobales bacterium]|nr:malonyl-CoA decarboxylase [Terriglobales bacterium]
MANAVTKAAKEQNAPAPIVAAGLTRRSVTNGEHSDALPGPIAAEDKRSFFKRLLRARAGGLDVPHRSAGRNARHAIALAHALMSERGEVSGARFARDALAAYQALGPTDSKAFFDLLVKQFSPDPEVVGRCADKYRNDPSQTNLIILQQAAEPPRQELFRRLNMASGGTGVLVDMRRRLLQGLAENPQWLGIEADLAHLLRSWFNRGFLTLQRIDWRSSALVLEKLINYEAVHQIQGWPDLRRRLQADRRCYAFFHPALPEEPLIFIEVALTRGMSAKVQPLLDPDSPVLDPAFADCAIFYSITNCQQGLRGVSFGNFLIKQVVEDLGRELPRLKVFATLSPVPGLRSWLIAAADASDTGPLHAELSAILAKLDVSHWFEDKLLSAELQRRLAPLCAYYLLYAKQEQEPRDPAARFHLVNGARLARLNWLGDTSATGMRQSAGIMVNYVYRLAEVERNHEAYARNRIVVA